MISFDFEYYKPDTKKEALEIYNAMQKNKKQVIYYGGGTEFISRARRNEIDVDAIIDIKGIPECSVFEAGTESLLMGSATTLTHIADANVFPLLSNIAKTIATHTERNKITIGGNMMSHLPYREIMMPLLVTNSIIHCFGDHGTREISALDITSSKDTLADNEFITHIQTPTSMMNQPFFNVKKTRQSAINYPIVSLAAIVHQGNIQVACSGVCEFTFRTKSFEDVLNDTSLSIEKRISTCIDAIPGSIINDSQATKEFRSFVFQQALSEMFSKIKGVA